MAVGMPRATSMAKVGPDKATTRAPGTHYAKCRTWFCPFVSMPFVTLTRMLCVCASAAATARNPCEATASTTHSCPRAAVGKSGSRVQCAGSSTPREITFAAPRALNLTKHLAIPGPEGDGVAIGLQHFGERSSPRAGPEPGDFHGCAFLGRPTRFSVPASNR